MNTDTLARATFVLDRVTSERLSAIAARMGVSRSALARDILAEPVELMHRWVTSLPAGQMTPDDAASLMQQIEADVGALLDSKSAQLNLLGGTGGDA